MLDVLPEQHKPHPHNRRRFWAARPSSLLAYVRGKHVLLVYVFFVIYLWATLFLTLVASYCLSSPPPLPVVAVLSWVLNVMLDAAYTFFL